MERERFLFSGINKKTSPMVENKFYATSLSSFPTR
jgi:hypothetical protein